LLPIIRIIGVRGKWALMGFARVFIFAISSTVISISAIPPAIVS